MYSEKVINIIILGSMNSIRCKKTNCVPLVAIMIRSSVPFSLKKNADFDFINIEIYCRVLCDDLEARAAVNGCWRKRRIFFLVSYQIINENFHESIERNLFRGVTVYCESICVVFSVSNLSRKKTRILLDMTTYSIGIVENDHRYLSHFPNEECDTL